MDWRMLIRRCPSRSFTIVGDVAQDFGAGWHPTLEQIDEPPVRRKPLGFERVDHQLP